MTAFVRKRLAALLRANRGATAVEYGLILAMIVLGAFAAINGVAQSTTGMWDNTAAKAGEVM